VIARCCSGLASRTWTPFTAITRSPGSSTPSAGASRSTAPTAIDVGSCRLKPRANRITKAISRFTNGPAAITTIRFQTGCA